MSRENVPVNASQYPVVHLVVDMQNRYVRNLAQQDQLILPQKLGNFLQKTHKDVPPVYVETVDEEMYWAEGEERKGYSSVFNEKALNADLAHKSRHEKLYSSAFKFGRTQYGDIKDSDINKQLEKLGARTVLVSGLYKDYCVWETAVDAAKLGYEVVILEDLCRNGKRAGRDPGETMLTPEFCAAHNVRLGRSEEFVDRDVKLRAAPHSVAAPVM